MTKAHIYTGPAAMLAGVPGFYFQMGLPDGGMVDRLSRWLPTRGALGCSEFVARAQASASHHRVLPVALGAAVAGLGGGVQRTPGEARALLGLPVEGRLVGIVGRLQEWKGMHHYVDAMAGLMERFPDLSGVIVGGRHEWEPEYPKRVETQIAAAGMNERIRMVGRQEQPALWMQAMDVVVHASDREPFGLVVVEAMALGRPVIASVPGGPAEIVRDAVDGLLVPFGDTIALGAAIARLLDDREFAKRCAANALERSVEFTETRYAQRLGAALRELLGRR